MRDCVLNLNTCCCVDCGMLGCMLGTLSAGHLGADRLGLHMVKGTLCLFGARTVCTEAVGALIKFPVCLWMGELHCVSVLLDAGCEECCLVCG